MIISKNKFDDEFFKHQHKIPDSYIVYHSLKDRFLVADTLEVRFLPHPLLVNICPNIATPILIVGAEMSYAQYSHEQIFSLGLGPNSDFRGGIFDENYSFKRQIDLPSFKSIIFVGCCPVSYLSGVPCCHFGKISMLSYDEKVSSQSVYDIFTRNIIQLANGDIDNLTILIRGCKNQVIREILSKEARGRRIVRDVQFRRKKDAKIGREVQYMSKDDWRDVVPKKSDQSDVHTLRGFVRSRKLVPELREEQRRNLFLRSCALEAIYPPFLPECPIMFQDKITNERFRFSDLGEESFWNPEYSLCLKPFIFMM